MSDKFIFHFNVESIKNDPPVSPLHLTSLSGDSTIGFSLDVTYLIFLNGFGMYHFLHNIEIPKKAITKNNKMIIE